MYEIVFIRHGQSQWNLENRFTGWVNVDLSENGIIEANSAAEKLKNNNFIFDLIYTSKLKRAINTANIIKEAMKIDCPMIENWRLNERHYGGLQGLNKAETAEKHGADQVKIWRRSFDTPPPSLTEEQAKDCQFEGAPLTTHESLKDTIDRTLPYWESDIIPSIKEGKKILVAAHGNSLRALVKHIFDISDEDIIGLEIPTGSPILIKLDENFKGISRDYLV